MSKLLFMPQSMPQHADDQAIKERLERQQSRHDDATWLRWASVIVVGMALGALSTIVTLMNKVAAMEVKEDYFQAQRVEFVNRLQAEEILISALNETIVRLTVKVDRLLDDQDRTSPRRNGPTFPDGKNGRFDR